MSEVKPGSKTDGLGGKRRNRQPRIEGTIISPLPEQKIVTVLWDGRTNPEGWHVDFLEKISQSRS